MKYFIKLFIALHLLVLISPIRAQTLPQELFTIGPFEIGKATLLDIQSILGSNNLTPIEPGDGADVAPCYSAGTSPFAPAVVFETGALGGWKEITAYRLTKRWKRRCQLTDASLITMSTANGLKYGAEHQLIERMLSQSRPMTSGMRMCIEELYVRKPTESEIARMRRSGSLLDQIEFGVVDTVEIRFKYGVIDDLYVKRLVSY